MSFLEMLDVLNEDLIAKGEEPVAFDHDCREGICGIVRVHDQRRRARSGTRNDGLPAPHASFQGRRRTLSRAVARQGVSRREGPRRRPKRVRPHHCQPAVSFRFRRAALRTEMPFSFPKKTPISRWMPQRASAAARAWPLARMRRQRYSRAQNQPSRLPAAGATGAVSARAEHGRAGEAGDCSAVAQISANAKRCARRKSNSKSLRE